jgi:hypothetical protein
LVIDGRELDNELKFVAVDIPGAVDKAILIAKR